MNLIFIRHGESQGNVHAGQFNAGHDTALTPIGIEQAKQAVLICRPYEPKYVYSSPYRRAIETAKIISEQFDTEPIVAEELSEINYGEWSRLTNAEIRQKMMDAGMWGWSEQKYSFRPPDGESFEDLEKRLRHLVEPLLDDSNDTMVFVTHNVLLKVVDSWMGQRPLKETLPLRYRTGSCLGFSYLNGKFKQLFNTS